MHHRILFAVLLGATSASNAGTSDCSGTVTFSQGPTTYLGCDGHLRLDDGFVLEADTAISLWASQSLAVLGATLRAPRIDISAGMIDFANLSILDASRSGTQIDNLQIVGSAAGPTPIRLDPRLFAGATILISGADMSVSGGSGHGATIHAGQPRVIDDGTVVLTGNIVTDGGVRLLPPTMITTIPEPETWAMMVAGLGLIAQIARRKFR